MVHKVRIFPFPLKSSVQMSTLYFLVMRWNLGYHLCHVNIFHKNLPDWILIHVRHVRKSFYLLRSVINRKSGSFLMCSTVSNFLNERISDHFTRHLISPKHGMTFRHPSRRHFIVTLNIFQSTLIPGFDVYVFDCSTLLSHIFREIR